MRDKCLLQPLRLVAGVGRQLAIDRVSLTRASCSQYKPLRFDRGLLACCEDEEDSLSPHACSSSLRAGCSAAEAETTVLAFRTFRNSFKSVSVADGAAAVLKYR